MGVTSGKFDSKSEVDEMGTSHLGRHVPEAPSDYVQEWEDMGMWGNFGTNLGVGEHNYSATICTALEP